MCKKDSKGGILERWEQESEMVDTGEMGIFFNSKKVQ